MDLSTIYNNSMNFYSNQFHEATGLPAEMYYQMTNLAWGSVALSVLNQLSSM